MTYPLNLGLINRRDRTDNPLGEQQDSKRMSNLKLNKNIIPMKKFDPIPDINRTNPRRIVNKMPPPLFPIPSIPPLNLQMHKTPEKTDSRRRKSQFDLLKGAPGNLKIIEKRILQKELEKKLDPSISSQLKSLQEINLKKREEKYQIKKKIEEERANKYQKSQLSRIHRIMKTINKE